MRSADTYLKCRGILFFGRQGVFCGFVFSAMKDKASWIQEVKIMEDIFIMEEREIKRGDIYHANLNPIVGSEQGGYRPVLVIQNDRGINIARLLLSLQLQADRNIGCLPMYR